MPTAPRVFYAAIGAVEALERIASADSQQLLWLLTERAADATMTKKPKAAMERMRQRKSYENTKTRSDSML